MLLDMLKGVVDAKRQAIRDHTGFILAAATLSFQVLLDSYLVEAIDMRFVLNYALEMRLFLTSN